jgi:NADH-quinone oxidoreductase subunit M
MIEIVDPLLESISNEDPSTGFFIQVIIEIICLGSAVYSTFRAVREKDMKKIIAYSSIAHMNLAMLALFSGGIFGLESCELTLISHGYVSAALFFIIGSLYDRVGTRRIDHLGGLQLLVPKFSFYFFFFTLANLGFPFTANFLGEILLLTELSQSAGYLIFIVLVIVLTIVYSLRLYSRIFLGTINNLMIINDLHNTEELIFFILMLCTILGGLMPGMFLLDI